MSTCVVTGKIVNSNGAAVEQAAVRATPVSDGNQEIFTSTGALLSEQSIETFTDPQGQFALELERGVEFIITVELTGYSRRKTIPNLSTVDIKDL